jgi:hypothetical protein
MSWLLETIYNCEFLSFVVRKATCCLEAFCAFLICLIYLGARLFLRVWSNTFIVILIDFFQLIFFLLSRFEYRFGGSVEQFFVFFCGLFAFPWACWGFITFFVIFVNDCFRNFLANLSSPLEFTLNCFVIWLQRTT